MPVDLVHEIVSSWHLGLHCCCKKMPLFSVYNTEKLFIAFISSFTAWTLLVRDLGEAKGLVANEIKNQESSLHANFISFLDPLNFVIRNLYISSFPGWNSWSKIGLVGFFVVLRSHKENLKYLSSDWLNCNIKLGKRGMHGKTDNSYTVTRYSYPWVLQYHVLKYCPWQHKMLTKVS